MDLSAKRMSFYLPHRDYQNTVQRQQTEVLINCIESEWQSEIKGGNGQLLLPELQLAPISNSSAVSSEA